MPRSYLFPGQDTEHLSPYQRMLEKLYDQTDRPGNRVTPSEFFKSPAYQQFVIQQYGEIQAPPGHQVLESSPFKMVTRDAQGYTHTYTRDVAGGNEGGQVTEQTDRPAILPNTQQDEFIRTLQGGMGDLGRQQQANALALARGEKVDALDPGIQQYLDQIAGISSKLSGPTQLLQLDDQTKAAFAAQSAAEQAKNQQQFQQQSGSLLAKLYGNRINQSSIANAAGGQLLQQQGLVTQQQQSDALMRELQARVALTEEERSRLNSALAGLGTAAGTKLQGFATTQGVSQAQTEALNRLLAELSGQTNTRDIASAGLGLDYKKLEEMIRQFNKNNTLAQLGIQTEQEKIDAAGGWLNNLLKFTNIFSGLAGATGGGLSAIKALKGLRTTAGRSTDPYNSSTVTAG